MKLSPYEAVECKWLWDIKDPTFSRNSANSWRWNCQPCALAALPSPPSPGRLLVLISVRGWVNLRAIVRTNGLGQLINLMTQSRIETTTFRLILCSATPHNLLNVSLRFETIWRLHFQCWKINYLQFLLPVSGWLIDWFILLSRKWIRHIPPKRRLTSNWLHHVISSMIEHFISTAVKTSNPIQSYLSS
jgi:hypothetical protein